MFREHDTVDVFIGIDVGKTDRHAVAIDRTGEKLLDKPLPQDEATLRAAFTPAFAAPRAPDSRTYYDRRRAEQKKHDQALIALARRRCDVLFAMLRDGMFYSVPTSPEPRIGLAA